MNKEDILIEKRESWIPPEHNGPEILAMPNIYYALQGKGMQPRTIEGATEWNKMRKKCYYKARWKCEACGEYLGPGKCQAHELFRTNWKKGESEFVRLVCLCEKCHLSVIHSGRALTMYQRGDYRMPKSKLLAGVEHGFNVVSNYNKTHDKPILLWGTFMQYWKEPSLKEDMERLFKKYGIKLYSNNKVAPWDKWHMIYNGKIYKTPYKDIDDYHRQMNLQHSVQNKKVENVADRRRKKMAELEREILSDNTKIGDF